MNKNCVLEETKNKLKSQVRRAPSREKMPSILRHRLPFTYRPARLPELSNSCIRGKIFVMFTVQSLWLSECLQQLREPRCLDVRTTSDHNHVCDISLVSMCKLGSPRTGIVHTLRLFKLSRPKGREFPRIFHFPLGVRRTVKSTTAAVVAGSLHAISANFIPKFTNVRPTGTSEYTSFLIHSDNSRTNDKSLAPRST